MSTKIKKGDMWTLTINVKRPSIFTSFQFPNYIDKANQPRDLKDVRGNVVKKGFIVSFISTVFDSSKPSDAALLGWLIDHPLVQTKKVSLVNNSQEKDEEIDHILLEGQLMQKVVELKAEDTRIISSLLGYNYNADHKTRRTSLIRLAKHYSSDPNSGFQRLQRALDNKDGKLHLLISELLEHKVIKYENGIYLYTDNTGNDYRMGISHEQVIHYLNEHDEIHAVLKGLLREAKKKQ